MKIILGTGIGNYYGDLDLLYDESKCKYFLAIDDYANSFGMEVSEEFAKAMIKEFNHVRLEKYEESPKYEKYIFVNDKIIEINNCPSSSIGINLNDIKQKG